jgi:hypothetical protein
MIISMTQRKYYCNNYYRGLEVFEVEHERTKLNYNTRKTVDRKFEVCADNCRG